MHKVAGLRLPRRALAEHREPVWSTPEEYADIAREEAKWVRW